MAGTTGMAPGGKRGREHERREEPVQHEPDALDHLDDADAAVTWL
jgi:hypothetical protein